MTQKHQWKGNLIPLDAITALPENERCYRLTDQHVIALLGLTEYLHWRTRWEPSTGNHSLTDEQIVFIHQFASDIETRLMTPGGCVSDCCNEFGPLPDGDLRLEDGVPQWSVDGGTTWIDLTEGPLDPSIPDPNPAEGDTDDEKLCSAASKATKVMNSFYVQTFAAFSNSLLDTFSGFINFLADLGRAQIQEDYSPYGALINFGPIADADLGSMFSAGPLTDEVQDAYRCLLYENATLEPDGTVSFEYDLIFENVIAAVGATQGIAISLLLAWIGRPGLNRSGSVGTADTSDCEDCSETPCEFSTGFTSGIPSQFHPMSDFPFTPPWGDHGEWSATGGNTDAGCLVGTNTGEGNKIAGYIDLLEDCNVRGFTLQIKSGNGTFWKAIKHYNEAGTLLRTVDQGDGGSAGVYRELDELPSAAVKRYIAFEFHAYTGGQINIDDIEVLA